MGDRSSIQWTDATWNPLRGCSRVSEGCRNCYAERIAARFSRLATMTPSGPRWTGEVQLVESALSLPLRWKTPRRIFVNSMSDLFHEKVADDTIAAIFGVMALADHHVFQILTKRPQRMREWANWIADAGEGPLARCHVEMLERIGLVNLPARLIGKDGASTWPLPNVWLGVSVEDQATADERIPLLLQTPAAVRWLSYEPALGPVKFSADWCDWLAGWDTHPAHECHGDEDRCRRSCPVPEQVQTERLDWIVVGGESGPGARPFDLAWARDTIAQCRAAGVPVFVKQMGRWILGDHAGFRVSHWLLNDGRGFVPPIIGPHAHDRPASAIGFSLWDRKGGSMDEWPSHLRVREFPR